MKNWKTTVVGALTGFGIIATQIVNLLDGKLETVFSIEALLAALAAIGIGWFAKDAGVTGPAK